MRAVLVIAGLALGAAAAVWERVEVTGASMIPTLAPRDRLLVRRRPPGWRPRVGDIVVVADPRTPSRRVVKRIASATGAGAWVLGDNPDASTDSREWGRLPWSAVGGTAVYRYFPASRSGRLAVRRSGGPSPPAPGSSPRRWP